MAERRESVRVTAEGSSFKRTFREMQADVAELKLALASLPNRVTVRGESRGFDKIERDARRAERSTSALADAGVALGPALVPVGAVAAPAIAGLAAQLGFAAGAAGTALLAFNGVGDALSALNAYQLDPSAANLDKLNQSMSNIAPAARDFVHELDRLSPVLAQLKDSASAGLFPGLTSGIESVLTRLPQVRAILSEFSDTTGDLFANAGKGLAGSGFDAFFDYLQANARPILTDLGTAIGGLTRGIANLFVAFAPLERDFSSFLAGTAQDFADWAAGLADSDGFAGFVDYVRESGPQVADALGSISTAIVAITRAAAPLGGPTLEILSTLADLIARIANSPLGTPLLAAAAALATFNRALTLSASAKDSFVADVLYGRRGADGVRGASGIARVRTQVTGLGRDLRSVAAANRKTSFGLPLASRAELERSTAAATRLRSTLGTVGKGAAGIGALTVATSGLGDKLGVTNTVSLALAGTMAGPVGAGVGAAAGAFLDLKAAGEQADDALTRLREANKSGDFVKIADALKDYKREFKDQNTLTSPLDLFSDGLKNISRVVAGKPFFIDPEPIRKTNTETENLASTLRGLAQLVGKPLPANASPKQLKEFAEQARPALEAAGIDLDKLASTGNFSGLVAGAQAIKEFGIAAAKVDAQAESLSTTLDKLLNPKVNLDAARDQLAQTIRGLGKLTSAGVDPSKQTAGAEANRALVRQAFADTQQLIQAQVQAGASSDVLAGTLAKSRKSIIDQGVAAGISRQEMVKYVNGLGLTPKLIETTIRANVEEAQGKIKNYLNILNITPKQKATIMNLAASGATGKLKAYINQLKLTPAQKATLIRALTASATGNIAAVQRQLNALRNKTVTVAVNTINTTVNRAIGSIFGGKKKEMARGGHVIGPGGPRDDLIPTMLSNGEFVINARAAQKYRREIEWINAQGLANGGMVGASASRVTVTPNALPPIQVTVSGDISGNVVATARWVAKQEIEMDANVQGMLARAGGR